MKSIVKQPILWMGLGILVVALIIVSGRLEDEANAVVKPQQAISTPSQSTDSASIADKQGVEQSQEAEHTHGIDRQGQVEADDKTPRHQDMLSEEMKQAIRDKLLLHGPMEVIHKPDGSFELPSNGRFTQMPVAVEMPDGSIQIKEYSVLPK